MRILREKRLNHELMNGVDIFELRSKLYQDKDWFEDNDRLLQAIDVYKDIKIVEKWNQMKDENGSCNGLTDKEYNSIKVSKMKNRTRRVHSKGNLWKHNDKQRIKRTIKHWWE